MPRLLLPLFLESGFFSPLLNCVPIARNWDKTVQGRCLPTTPLWLTNAALNIATDMIILLPLPVIRSLRLPLKQKPSLAIIFAFGLLYGIRPVNCANSWLTWVNTAIVFVLFRSSASIHYTLAPDLLISKQNVEWRIRLVLYCLNWVILIDDNEMSIKAINWCSICLINVCERYCWRSDPVLDRATMLRGEVSSTYEYR